MLNIREVKARIESMQDYSGSLRVFRLRLADDFSFAPGQFVMLSIPGLVDSNGRKIAKAYSISSSPDEKTLELCIVHYQNGALSPTLFKMPAGSEVTVTGTYGLFVLKEPVPLGAVFIAGGTGLAPILSMLRFLYSKGFKGKLWLFYSMSEPRLFLFRDELLGYQKNNGLQLVASTSNPGANWLFEKGRVTDAFPGHAAKIPKDSGFYLCGPPAMVIDTVKMLEELGYKKENIHREQW